MPRRARLTILELGASPVAWTSQGGRDADDCIVVAQQSDESGPQFTERVRKRALRLRSEDASLESVDVYTAPRQGARSSGPRASVIEALAGQLTAGTQLTLWSNPKDAEAEAELTASLAQFAHLLVERRVAANGQACESELKSGIRHALPTPPYVESEPFDEELVAGEPYCLPSLARLREKQ